MNIKMDTEPVVKSDSNVSINGPQHEKKKEPLIDRPPNGPNQNQRGRGAPRFGGRGGGGMNRGGQHRPNNQGNRSNQQHINTEAAPMVIEIKDDEGTPVRRGGDDAGMGGRRGGAGDDIGMGGRRGIGGEDMGMGGRRGGANDDMGMGGGRRGGGEDNMGMGGGRRGGGDDMNMGGRRGGGGDDMNMGGRRGGGGGGGMGRGRGDDFMMLQKLKALSGPMVDLPPIETGELKFAGRNRLYIGNLTNDVTEEEVIEMFKPYGETSERFINKEKNFAFIRLDYHANAEKAKTELDGFVRKGRPLRVRFAPNATVVKVKNLTQWVSNELLYKAFEIFGVIERCVIIVDDRGKSTGEGVVEFSRKAGAMCAIRNCTEKCFFLTASLRPVVVEPYEHSDEIDGFQEKNILRKNPDFFKARQVGPRFAEPNSFEHEYGTRWKQLHELFKQKTEALKREMHMEEEKLEAQMEYARYEHETEMLRAELRQREQDRDRQKREWELKERQAEEQRTRDDELMRRQSEEMQVRMHHQEEELRRRQQENTLFMQAQQLNSLLDQQEQGIGGSTRDNFDSPGERFVDEGSAQELGYGHGNVEQFDHAHGRGGSRFDDLSTGAAGQRKIVAGGNRGHWGNESRREDYQNKRRRF